LNSIFIKGKFTTTDKADDTIILMVSSREKILLFKTLMAARRVFENHHPTPI